MDTCCTFAKLSKCTTVRENTNVNSGLGVVMMCQYRLISCPPLWWGTWLGEEARHGYVCCWGGEKYM